MCGSQIQQLRHALDKHAERLDEALLSNAFAWIKKSSEDSFDGMVQLLQLVLQLYAARSLRTPSAEGVEGALNQVRAGRGLGREGGCMGRHRGVTWGVGGTHTNTNACRSLALL